MQATQTVHEDLREQICDCAFIRINLHDCQCADMSMQAYM